MTTTRLAARATGRGGVSTAPAAPLFVNPPSMRWAVVEMAVGL